MVLRQMQKVSHEIDFTRQPPHEPLPNSMADAKQIANELAERLDASLNINTAVGKDSLLSQCHGA